MENRHVSILSTSADHNNSGAGSDNAVPASGTSTSSLRHRQSLIAARSSCTHSDSKNQGAASSRRHYRCVRTLVFTGHRLPGNDVTRRGLRLKETANDGDAPAASFYSARGRTALGVVSKLVTIAPRPPRSIVIYLDTTRVPAIPS